MRLYKRKPRGGARMICGIDTARHRRELLAALVRLVPAANRATAILRPLP